MRRGRLFGVGVGVGDPELMTLKAVRVLRESELLALPSGKKEGRAEDSVAYRIAVQSVPELNKKEQLMLYLPMTKDRASLERAWETSAEQIQAELDVGKNVAFPVIGDPCIYSTFSYIEEILREKGYDTEYVNGIPSFCAAAASLGIPLVQGEEALRILPGSVEGEKWSGVEQDSRTVDRKQEAEKPLAETLVLMKGGRNMKAVREQLRSVDKEVYMVENCGFETEKKYQGVDKLPEKAEYLSLLILKEQGKK